MEIGVARRPVGNPCEGMRHQNILKVQQHEQFVTVKSRLVILFENGRGETVKFNLPQVEKGKALGTLYLVYQIVRAEWVSEIRSTLAYLSLWVN